MSKSTRFIFTATVLYFISTFPLLAQDRKWYVGGEISQPETYYKVKGHLVGGVFGGYRFNSFLSLEMFGRMGYMDYRLPANHSLHNKLDKDALLLSDVDYKEVGFAGNFDALHFFLKKDTPFSLEVSPKMGLALTQSNLGVVSLKDAYRLNGNSKTRLTAGALMNFSYTIKDLVRVGLYGGITYATGNNMDLFDDKHPNLIIDKGVRMSVALGPKLHAKSRNKGLNAKTEVIQKAEENDEQFPEIFFFEQTTDKLLNTEFLKLKVLKKFLQDNPQLQITLEGYSDVKSPNSLAQDRAEFIKNWLVNEGISGTRIHLEINKKSSSVPRVEIKKMN